VAHHSIIFTAVGEDPQLDISFLNPTAVATLNSNIAFVPTFSPLVQSTVGVIGPMQIPQSSGLLVEYRPVAMSVLTTSMVPDLVNGGIIAAALIPGGADKKNYTANNNTLSGGQFQYFSTLAKCPSAFNTKINKGTYTRWEPEDNSDWEFKEPSIAMLHDYPSIVVSGVFTPDNPQNQLYQLQRVKIVTVYEFTTMSTMFELKAACCPDQHLENVLMVLKNFAYSMENEEHQSFIRRAYAAILEAARSGFDFYSKNSNSINSIVGLLGSMAIV